MPSGITKFITDGLLHLMMMLAPQARILSTPWNEIWKAQLRRQVRTSVFAGYALAAVGYLLHYYLVDSKLGLTSDWRWAAYRFGLSAGAVLLAAVTTHAIFSSLIATRLLFFVYGIGVAYLQSESMTWYSRVPYFWAVLLPILVLATLRLSVIPSLVLCGFLYFIEYKNFLIAGVSAPLTLGAFLVGLFILALLRSREFAEVSVFIATQENLEIQKKLFESQKELSDQIQAFLPGKIRLRLLDNISRNKMSVVQAMDEVLRPRETKICALLSDIRGFTRASKNINYIKNSVLPQQQTATDIVEREGGIPDQAGDLILAYFDEQDESKNALASFASALRISIVNLTLLKGSDQKRHIILDCGDAIVGNVGAAESGRQITVLGSCVNHLFRLDEVTKQKALMSVFSSSSIVISLKFFELLSKSLPEISVKPLNLLDLNLAVRDFPETTEVMVFSGDPFSTLSIVNSATNNARKTLEVA